MSREKMMELGSNKGIAGEFGFKSLQDVLSLTPFDRRWEGQAGTSQDSLSITVNFASSPQEFHYLEEEFLQEHACNHEPTTGHSAPTIGEQLTYWEQEKGCVAVSLELHRIKFCSYQDEQGNDDYWEFLPLTPIDWGKLRRRIEDTLRKTQDKQVLFFVAQYLNCKIY